MENEYLDDFGNEIFDDEIYVIDLSQDDGDDPKELEFDNY